MRLAITLLFEHVAGRADPAPLRRAPDPDVAVSTSLMCSSHTMMLTQMSNMCQGRFAGLLILRLSKSSTDLRDTNTCPRGTICVALNSPFRI